MTGAVDLWRIATDAPGYLADDMSGKGAEVTGGRWNAVGTPLVYASMTRALACLETTVHLPVGTLPLNRYLVRIEIPDDIWAAREIFDAARHVGWDALPASKTSIEWGSRWAASLRGALVCVPSVVVHEEFNVLVNPQHPDASKIHARKLRKWTYDPRASGATLLLP